MFSTLDDLLRSYRRQMGFQSGEPEPMQQSLLYYLLACSTITGLGFICWRLSQFIRLLLSLFILPGKSLRSFGAPSKTWAVITGASDGIGKEFAFHLARAGYSTLLVSRTQSKLDAVAAEIKQKYNTLTRTLVIDFASASPADYARLADEIRDLDVSILINNVGLSHSIPVPFAQTPAQELTDIITINCLATLRVTQAVVPGMISRKRRGLILTMGSFGGTYPTPLLATYSGSKAFLQHWSTALGAELSPHGITVTLVQSYLVTSAMSKVRRASLLIPNPRAFAAATLTKLGRSGGAQGWMYTCTPYWSHAGLQWLVGSFVGNGNGLLLMYNRWVHEGIRDRALRKQQRERKKKATGRKGN